MPCYAMLDGISWRCMIRLELDRRAVFVSQRNYEDLLNEYENAPVAKDSKCAEFMIDMPFPKYNGNSHHCYSEIRNNVHQNR